MAMKVNKVFKNVSWIIGCKIAQSGFALVINILTARYFGPSNYGLINYAASLVAFVTPIATLGINDVLVNEIIKVPEREGEMLGTSIVLSFVSSLCCIGGLFAFVSLGNSQDTTTRLVVVLYSLLLLSQSLEQIQFWFHAKYLSKYVSLVSFATYLVISVYKILLLVYEKSIYWFAVSHSLDYALIAIVLLVIYTIKDGQKLKFSIYAAKALWGQGKHYIMPGLMGLVLAQSDRVMLRFMCGDTEVGFYSAALSITSLSGFVFSALVTSFRPLLLESKQLSRKQYESNLVKLYGIVEYMSLAQSVLLTLLAKVAVLILYGAEYLPASPMLRIAVWYTAFSYIGSVRAIWILAEGKQAYMWIISLSGMILNVILNLILIPALKGQGAAIATLATQIFTNIVIVCIIKPLRPNLTYVVKGLNVKHIFDCGIVHDHSSKRPTGDS